MVRIIISLFVLSLFVLVGVVAFRVYPEELGRLAEVVTSSQPQPSADKNGSGQPASTDIDEPDAAATPTPDIKPQLPEDLKNTEALLERGDNFFEGGFLSLAINDFSNATELSSGNQTAWMSLINAQLALRDYDAAEQSAIKALETFPGNRDFLILLGETLLQKSEFTKAKRTFEELPESPARKYYLGIMAMYFDDFTTAENLLTEVKADTEFSERARVVAGAFEEFSLFPDSSELHLRLLLTKALNELRFYEMAIQKAKRILQEREDYRDAWIILGHSYLSLERYDLARNVLNKALELDPTKPETTFFLALADSALGDHEQAITHLSMARENGFKPESEVTKALAETFLAAKYYEAARQEFEKLIDKSGNSAASYVQPITISIDLLNDPTTAKLLAEQAVEYNPDSMVALNLLGWALLEGGKYNEAQEVLDQVIIAQPEFAPAYLNLGRLAEKKDNTDQAIEYFKTAYDLAPHSEIGAMAAERYNMLVLEE